MTTEEKLKHFSTITVENVHTDMLNTTNEYKATVDKLYEEHVKQATEQCELEEKIAVDGLKRKASTEFSAEHSHIKRKITRKQNELKDKLYQEVTQLLQDYRKSPAYTELLLNQIKEALLVAGDDTINIYIDPEDNHLFENLCSQSNFQLTLSESSFMGGIKAVIPSRNILIDNSFASKLAESKEKYIITF